MTEKGQYLRPMLDSGSSRVFNCNDRSRKLKRERAENPFFFKVAPLNGIVVLKEAVVADGSHQSASRRAIGTKLYFPYNANDVYEGGRSAFLHDPKLMNVLNELFGLQGRHVSKDDILADLKLLQVLDGLPSLDAFLMRDALENEGVAGNELFFEVTEVERLAIYDYIRRKFEPLVRAAFSDQSVVSGRVNHLIDKIWEAKDRAALDPLIRACRFPEEDALSIFAAWKGINFYAFEYDRTRAKREAVAVWLRDKATPRNFGTKGDADYIARLRRDAVARLRHHWTAVDAIVQEYDALYTAFVTNPDAVADFVGFLRNSTPIYWRMGDSLSKINHAVHCWDLSTVGFADRRLPIDRLERVLNTLLLVLSEERSAEPDMSWHMTLGAS